MRAAVVVTAFAVAGAASASGATGRAVADPEPPTVLPFHGFLLDRGRYAAFDVPRSVKTVAGRSNDRGLTAGGYTDASGEHGFLRDERGGFRRIDVPGARGTSAAQINDRGQIVGYYSETGSLEDPNAVRRGFLLYRGRFTRIDVPGAVQTQVLGINNHGRVVGEY